MNKRETNVPEKDLALQREYMSRMLEINERQLSETGRRPLAAVRTYGCQQNEADSQLIRGMAAEMGWDFTDNSFEADLIVLNTCAIREHAEHRILGNVGALVHSKRRNPRQLIAMCGCMVQQPKMTEHVKNSVRHVDLVFGTHALYRFPELLFKAHTRRTRVFDIEDSDGMISEGLPVRRDSNIRAWLSVMYGCNNYCSYCIVPYVRGRERSRSYVEIMKEARELVSSGIKDITLLGQNVNSYGNDLDDGRDFASLLSDIAALPGDFLVRFMTSHPKDATKRLFDAMAASPRVARQIHLPVQSGSDRILAEMNRGYTAESYMKLIEYARGVMPDIAITSDIIVGFPGETESDFVATLDLLRAVEYDAIFNFIYSKREGTPAASMPDDVDRVEKVARFDRMLTLQQKIGLARHQTQIGTVQRVLVDGLGRETDFPLSARTNGGRLVHMRGPAELVGAYADAKITSASAWALFGEYIAK